MRHRADTIVVPVVRSCALGYSLIADQPGHLAAKAQVTFRTPSFRREGLA